MKIESVSAKGNFKLIDRETVIFELQYVHWFSGKAKTIYQYDTIEIKPKNFWTCKYFIYKNDKAIGDISFSLKGYMTIRLEIARGREVHYILKNIGTFKLQFELQNENKERLCLLTSINKWKKLNYDYTIERTAVSDPYDFNELLIYCGYAANLYLEMISAA